MQTALQTILLGAGTVRAFTQRPTAPQPCRFAAHRQLPLLHRDTRNLTLHQTAENPCVCRPRAIPHLPAARFRLQLATQTHMSNGAGWLPLTNRVLRILMEKVVRLVRGALRGSSAPCTARFWLEKDAESTEQPAGNLINDVRAAPGSSPRQEVMSRTVKREERGSSRDELQG